MCFFWWWGWSDGAGDSWGGVKASLFSFEGYTIICFQPSTLAVSPLPSARAYDFYVNMLLLAVGLGDMSYDEGQGYIRVRAARAEP